MCQGAACGSLSQSTIGGFVYTSSMARVVLQVASRLVQVMTTIGLHLGIDSSALHHC